MVPASRLETAEPWRFPAKFLFVIVIDLTNEFDEDHQEEA